MYQNAIFMPYKCSAAITAGYAVALASDGTVALAATATLSSVIGIAKNATSAAGDVCFVQVYGYCDYAVTDGNVAATDLIVYALDGGTIAGATEAEVTSDPTIGYWMLGKNLLAADSAANIGTIFICPGSAA